MTADHSPIRGREMEESFFSETMRVGTLWGGDIGLSISSSSSSAFAFAFAFGGVTARLLSSIVFRLDARCGKRVSLFYSPLLGVLSSG